MHGAPYVEPDRSGHDQLPLRAVAVIRHNRVSLEVDEGDLLILPL